MTDTKTRLVWLLSQLDNLNNGGNIRYEGNTTFQGARAELEDIINTYVDNSAEPAPVNLTAMTPDQVDQVVARFVASVPASLDPASIVGPVSAAITDSQGAIIAACAPTAAPAPAP